MLYPFKFIPVYRKTLWGGRNLEKFGKRLPDGKIGESFEVSTLPGECSIVANGMFRGMSLEQLIELYPRPVLGFMENPGEFPLLFKLIDANDTLSVQVHPDNTYAQMHEDKPYGKHEAWVILEAQPGAQILYGLKPHTDKELFYNALHNGQIRDFLYQIEVYPGDVFDVPPGMVHALGKGIVLAEIQQNSDLTYRLYDFDRRDEKGNPRPLQQKKALDVIDLRLNQSPPIIQRATKWFEFGCITSLIHNRYFVLESVNCVKKYSDIADGQRFMIYFLVSGEAKLQYPNGELYFKKGETVLVPAYLGSYSLSGNYCALRIYRPDSQSL